MSTLSALEDWSVFSILKTEKRCLQTFTARYKFCLLTLCGNANPATAPEFAFFLRQTEQLKEDDRRFSLTVDDFTLFNPNTRTCPIFRSRRDMEIARKMYRRSGVLWKEARNGEIEANPWGISFMQMFNMTSDSGLFHTLAELNQNGGSLQGNTFVCEEKRFLPLYEAKLFYQFDHRFATFEGVSEQGIRKGNARPVTPEEKSDPSFVVLPRYWIAEEEVLKRLDKRDLIPQPNHQPNQTKPNQTKPNQTKPNQTKPNQTKPNQTKPNQTKPNQTVLLTHGIGAQLAFRDITNSTNERSEVVTVIPLVAVGHTATIVLLGSLPSGTLQPQQIGERQSLPSLMESQP